LKTPLQYVVTTPSADTQQDTASRRSWFLAASGHNPKEVSKERGHRSAGKWPRTPQVDD